MGEYNGHIIGNLDLQYSWLGGAEILGITSEVVMTDANMMVPWSKMLKWSFEWRIKNHWVRFQHSTTDLLARCKTG